MCNLLKVILKENDFWHKMSFQKEDYNVKPVHHIVGNASIQNTTYSDHLMYQMDGRIYPRPSSPHT